MTNSLIKLLSSILLIGLTSYIQAGEYHHYTGAGDEKSLGYLEDSYLFKSGENQLGVNLAMFDAHGFGEEGKGFDEEELGGTVSFSHYLSRYFALGIEYGYVDGFEYAHIPSGTATLRLPWDRGGMAFLIDGGVGGVFGDFGSDWSAHVGGGVEFRLLEKLSTTVGYRYFETGGADFYAATYGLKWIF